MSFLKSTYNLLTDKRDIKEPVIHKEFNERSETIRTLEQLAKSEDSSINQKKVKDHLKLFTIGQTGEKSVLFELRNSMLPIIVLHDVYIEFEDYEAQLDFVIVTHKFILVLEVKKLFGNVKVTDKGEFQRVITRGNRVVNKEGMYSPVSQTERQTAILEKCLKAMGVIKKCPIRYAVTFANPRTILEVSKKAPKEIQSRIIRHDQIKSFLTRELEEESTVFMMDNKINSIADAIRGICTEKPFNREAYLLNREGLNKVAATIKPVQNDEELTKSLKDFRLGLSRELDVKAFYIFTNKTLAALVEHRPETMDQLLDIEGIGPKKAQEFGEEILKTINS
ncbi:HRDC domain-containing protein [Virgibacillus kekensis]|uniref:HRDC domain-containing protein n=1 Tax=Virgibacillus kekensis TaxID=202261 RepID=A0ABV9DLN0_9BACI